MSIKTIKERYKRFKQWQEKPQDYEFASTEEQHCNNCGHSFTGNYCPYCSQKAGEGDISWSSVRKSIMDIWGLGSRSLPSTVGQLLLRPGYLISDYISGKRQVSFPPVKMLFIIAVIIVFWIFYLLPKLRGEGVDVYGGFANMFDGFTSWNKGHFVWTYFIVALCFIVPTWVMFRYSPRHTRHTLPQGFFIQIFLLVLNLFFSFLVLSPLLFLNNYNYYLYISILVIIVYYFIAYKQLFGYGIWGTLWRFIIVFASMVYMFTSLLYFIFGGDSSVSANGLSPYALAGGAALYSLGILAAGWGINMIVTRITRKASSKPNSETADEDKHKLTS
ncbi:MAG: DUF3667 domain-containing protein [Muribaculaceae bacterium]|nr:DUF3667 domain-containing protein [Muribaculaceae bacterium]